MLDMVPILGTQDIPTIILCTAMTGLCGLVIHLIPVVVREFLACRDIPDRYNPDDTPELFGVTVGLTRMINTDYSVLCIRFVLMRLSRLHPMKVLATQRLQSLPSASSASG